MTDDAGDRWEMPTYKRRHISEQKTQDIEPVRVTPIQPSLLARAFVEATIRTGAKEDLSHIRNAIHFTTLKREKENHDGL